MNEIVKFCKIHGKLTKKETIVNRMSPKGKLYLRCRICRNNSEKNRINKTKYIYTPKKHTKNKLPDFVTKENRSHAYTIRHRFKLDAEKYYELLKLQNKVCAICKKQETQKKKKSSAIKMLSIDHCHVTGKIRGLLCFKCNTGIGSFCDSTSLLQSAIEYLKASI